MNFAYIDEKYIRQSSMYLNRFRDVGNGTYNARCPYCGDSNKSELKARGYFYTTTNGIWRYKCHNCAVNVSIPSFIKFLAPSLYSEYTFEYFKERDGDKPKFIRKKKESAPANTRPKKQEEIISEKVLSSMQSIRRLDDENLGVKYLKERRIPLDRMNQLYYTDNLKDVVANIPNYDIERVPNIAGIILPYFNNDQVLESFQIRNIDSKSNMRYLTYDIIEKPSHIFNLHNINAVDQVYVFEGAFDSMFCDNGVAASGASIMQKLDQIKEVNENVTIVFDNDYKTNKDIFPLLVQVIDAGYSVVLFDDEMNGYKDINQFALNKNKSTTEITEYLLKCTKTGIDAKLVLASHKRTRGSIKWANEIISTPNAKRRKTNNDSLKVARRDSIFKI